MDWGDIPAWAAFGLSGAALLVAWKARGDGKRSADAAEASAAEARRSSDASERSATAAEASLALQQQEADARQAAEAEAARPRVRLALHWHRGQIFHLVNEGSAPAENLQLLTISDDASPLEPLTRLGVGEGAEFLIMTGLAGGAPTTLEFIWDGQEEPVRLRIPRSG
ncbi:hypothetical protein [Streptomyces sp. NPDC058757]|uniref:hypothetical protein n=1 Tax=Streptomyces sp. NPDC058757 TaxID=3346626 RepID=UPI0036A44915